MLQSSLSQQQAITRFDHFAPHHENLSYDIFLKLQRGDDYEGIVSINLDLQKVSNDLFLDAAIEQILHIKINGADIPNENNYANLRDRRFLNIPEQHLKVGRNLITIQFRNKYSKDGNGLHTFVDTDLKQYVYSNCEPYSANRIFPMFDQPDLKAVFKLTLEIPKDWVGISNEPIDHAETDKLNYIRGPICSVEALKFVAFKPTKRLSTYLYAIIAGPYLEVPCKNPYKDIQMSFFSRESLFQHLLGHADEMFEITIEGIKFYESFFGYPFPFTKYDQIFCPEYNVGAMENPGAVTFNDLYIFKEQVALERKTSRANTITHELAHMWFGDLVTMKWWNDLWLNESFADYISHLCLTKENLTTVKLSNVWLQFFNRKGWGYREDQLSTTHPIAGEVLTTQAAETIFDGITYSKGAATLKQLLCLIGENNFSKAMASYFHKYQWSNATLQDFINNLQGFYQPLDPSYPADLNSWKEEWLTKAGLNECRPEWNPEDKSDKAEIRIHQTVALEQHPTLRHHKMKIAFFDHHANIVEVKDIVIRNTPFTNIPYNGSLGYAAILLNYDDEAYIKVRIDNHSINFFRQNLGKITSEFTRASVWRALWDMCRDGQLSSLEFVEIAANAIENEPSDSILSNIISFSSGALINFAPRDVRHDILYPKLFEAVLKLIERTDKTHTNRIVLLRDALINFARVGEKTEVDNVRHVLDWFNGDSLRLKEVELGLANKWSIVAKAFRYKKLSEQEKRDIYNKVAEIDKSDTSKTYHRKCEASIVNPEGMKALWESFLDEKNPDSVKLIGASMDGFNHNIHREELENVYHHKFFEIVPHIFKTRAHEYGKEFYHSLFPNADDLHGYLHKVNELIQQATGGEEWLLIILRQSADDLQRRLRAFECLRKYLESKESKL